MNKARSALIACGKPNLHFFPHSLAIFFRSIPHVCVCAVKHTHRLVLNMTPRRLFFGCQPTTSPSPHLPIHTPPPKRICSPIWPPPLSFYVHKPRALFFLYLNSLFPKFTFEFESESGKKKSRSRRKIFSPFHLFPSERRTKN